MTNLDYLFLGTGGLALAAVVGYAFWVQVRSVLLRVELLETYAELRQRASQLDGLCDPAYISACKTIDAFLYLTEELSFPFFTYLVSVGREWGKENAPAKSNDPKLQQAIDGADRKLQQGVAHYITHHTLTGMVFWLLLRSLPRPVAREEVREAVAASTSPLQVISHRMPLRHCSG